MSRSSSLSLSLALWLLAACGGPARPPTTLHNEAVAAESYLVWVPDGAAPPPAADQGDEPPPQPLMDVVTRWVDAGGVERGRARGLWIASGDRLWRVERTERKVAVKGCQERDDGSIEPGSADLVDLDLVSADGRQRVPLVHGQADDEVAEQSDGARVVAGLGPYLALESSSYVYACGAHGGVSASASVFDVAAMAPVKDAWATDASVAHLAAAAREQIEDPGLGEDDAPFHVGETIPAWQDGALRVRHLLWVDACYACGNGLWSSYTSAAWVDDDQVPAPLAKVGASVPPAVGRLLEGVDGGGITWGTPDDTWRKVFGGN